MNSDDYGEGGMGAGTGSYTLFFAFVFGVDTFI